MTEVARNARQVSRDLDGLAADMPTRDASGRAEGLALNRTGHREAGGKLFFQTDADPRQPAAGPAAGQGRQPDPRGRAGAARAASPARRGAGVEGHQHARQGARAGPAGGRLLQRQDARRRRPALHRRSRRCLPTSGTSTARRWRAGSRAASPSTASAARSCRSCSSTSSSISKHRARRRSTPASPRSPARPRCCKHAQGLHPPEERRSGA